MFHPNPAFLVEPKVEISPKGLTLRVKADIEKNFSICPKLLINAEHYGLVWTPKAEKKDTIKFGRPICNPLCQCSSIY
jgi:hypothetical protein